MSRIRKAMADAERDSLLEMAANIREEVGERAGTLASFIIKKDLKMRPKERESDIQKTILEGLSALRIWHIRMNSGAMFAEYGGKKRMLRFGRKGMGDILALPVKDCGCGVPECPVDAHFGPLWIEVKRPGEKQTPDQIAFQAEVEAEGHRYLVITSWEELLEKLR